MMPGDWGTLGFASKVVPGHKSLQGPDYTTHGEFLFATSRLSCFFVRSFAASAADRGTFFVMCACVCLRCRLLI